jgi:hypothetical protein
MDIQKALRELYEEKKRLDWTIATLESRLKNVSSYTRSRRGRKSMGGDERLEVSKRMSAYWAARRAEKRAEKPDRRELEIGKMAPSDEAYAAAFEPQSSPNSQSANISEDRLSA